MEPQSEAQSRVTVMIVDDDRFAREALRLLLQGPGIEVISLCGSPEECLDAVVARPPQVALVDMRMQGDPYAGVEVIRQTRRLSPATACLALTASDRRGDLLPKAFYAGAHGYYLKGYVLGAELPRIVRRLAAGAWEIDPDMAKTLLRESGSSESAAFTLHEREMLGQIAAGAKAQELAGAFDEGEPAIHTRIRNIMDKAQAARSAEIERLNMRYR